MKSTTTTRVGVLQELLTRLQDSAFGYSKAMHLTSHEEFAGFCKTIARERGLLAAELGLVIADLGGEADFRGSKEARIDRAWIQFSCQILNHMLPAISDLHLVHTCQRAEHALRKNLHHPLSQRTLSPAHLMHAIRCHTAGTVNRLEAFARSTHKVAHRQLAASAY